MRVVRKLVRWLVRPKAAETMGLLNVWFAVARLVRFLGQGGVRLVHFLKSEPANQPGNPPKIEGRGWFGRTRAIKTSDGRIFDSVNDAAHRRSRRFDSGGTIGSLIGYGLDRL